MVTRPRDHLHLLEIGYGVHTTYHPQIYPGQSYPRSAPGRFDEMGNHQGSAAVIIENLTQLLAPRGSRPTKGSSSNQQRRETGQHAETRPPGLAVAQ
jgi:hypothetical protein